MPTVWYCRHPRPLHGTDQAAQCGRTGKRWADLHAGAEAFGRRLEKAPRFIGAEATAGWLTHSGEHMACSDIRQFPSAGVMDWVSDSSSRGLRSLGKEWRLDGRDGNF